MTTKGSLPYLIALQLLLGILMPLYILARDLAGLPVFLFWPIAWLFVIVSFFLVQRMPRRYTIVALSVLCVSISLVKLASSPEPYVIGRDLSFEAQVATIITEQGTWNPQVGSGFAENYFAHNPVLHILTAFSSLATGLSSPTFLKYFMFGFSRLLLVILGYLLIEAILGKENHRVSALAGFLFAIGAGLSFVDISRRTMSGIFVLLAIFAIIKAAEERDHVWDVLFLFFSGIIVMANHSISFYFFTFLLGMFIAGLLLRLVATRDELSAFPKVGLKLSVFVAMFIAWEVFGAPVLFHNDLSYFDEILDTSGSGIKDLFLGTEEKTYAPNIYYPYETLLIMGAHLVFWCLGFLGMALLFVRLLGGKYTMRHFFFLLYFAVYGLSAYAISLFMIQFGMDVAVIIILWFFSIPVCMCIALFWDRIASRWDRRYGQVALCILLMFLATGSLMMGIFTPRVTNRAAGEDIIIGMDSRSKSLGMFEAGKWLYEHGNRDANLVGDIDSFEMFSGFFRFEVNSYSDELEKVYFGSNSELLFMIFRDSIDFGSYRHTRVRDEADYFIINRAFSRYQSTAFHEPIPWQSVERLDRVIYLDRVYDNYEVGLYKVERDARK